MIEVRRHGFRNARATLIAPAGTTGIVMDCDTTGVEPDFALAKTSNLADGGVLRVVNRSVGRALAARGRRADPRRGLAARSQCAGRLPRRV